MKSRYRTTSPDDLFQTMLRFHREFALPDMERLLDYQTRRMVAHFDRVETMAASPTSRPISSNRA
jgi:hypothetical protein